MPLPICEYCAHCDADLTIDALWQVPGSIAIFCYACAKDLSRAVSYGHMSLADVKTSYEEDTTEPAQSTLTDPSANDSLSRY